MEKYGNFLKTNSPRGDKVKSGRRNISNEDRLEKLNNDNSKRGSNRDKMNRSYITEDNRGLPKTNFDYGKYSTYTENESNEIYF